MKISGEQFKKILAKTAEKKVKRAQKVLDNALLGIKSPQDAPRKPIKTNKGPSTRKRAFARLKANCINFVLLRAKHRTGGFCEVGIVCKGRGPIELWYHVTPQAMGNALKYDDRNILGSCRSCNGGEYFARKRGSNVYKMRHAEILGAEHFTWLEANQGRKQISTAEANEMADVYAARIEWGDWRDSPPCLI
jgi:hypothetical protein